MLFFRGGCYFLASEACVARIIAPNGQLIDKSYCTSKTIYDLFLWKAFITHESC